MKRLVYGGGAIVVGFALYGVWTAFSFLFPLHSNNMKGFVGNIEKLTVENNSFRKVLYTAEHSQLVLMSLLPQEEIGEERHKDHDQFFRVESGQGTCIIDGNEYSLTANTAIIVPAGAEHNVINTSATEELKLYTIYSPAHHKDGLEYVKKEDAIDNDQPFDGVTTE